MKDIEALKAEIDATPMTDYMRMIFKRVLDTTNVESLTGQEKIDYERDLKHYRDYMGTMYCAKEEGRAEGIAKGRAEEKLSIAKSLKSQGISIDVIIASTGLTKEEIAEL